MSDAVTELRCSLVLQSCSNFLQSPRSDDGGDSLRCLMYGVAWEMEGLRLLDHLRREPLPALTMGVVAHRHHRLQAGA